MALTAAHGKVEQLTRQLTTSASYGDVSGASIASGNFIAGKKYLLVITALLDSTGTNNYCGVKVIHGSTAFSGSLAQDEPDTSTTSKIPYFWFTVWTAVASEAVTIQLRTETGAVETGIDNIEMVWLQLSDDFVENTDWFFNETNVNTTLTNAESSTDNATLTFTPATAGEKWLILCGASETVVSLTLSYQSRLLRTGEATETLSEIIEEGEDAAGQYVPTHMAVLTLGNASNTFTEKSLLSAAGTTETRGRSAVFALNLSRFRNAEIHRTLTETDCSATDYATQLETVTLTPATAGDVWAMGYFVFDPVSALSTMYKARLQVDNTDDPAGQTTDAFDHRWGHNATVDQGYWVGQTLTSQTAAAHTYDFDASASSAVGGRGGLYRSLFAVTMALPRQAIVPASDVTDGNWLNESASNVNLFASVDEGETANDSDWIQSPNIPVAEMAEVKLTGVTAPPAGTVSIVVRHSTA